MAHIQHTISPKFSPSNHFIFRSPAPNAFLKKLNRARKETVAIPDSMRQLLVLSLSTKDIFDRRRSLLAYLSNCIID